MTFRTRIVVALGLVLAAGTAISDDSAQVGITGQLLVNGNFSTWEAGLPAGWDFRDRPPNMELAKEKYEGMPILRMNTPNAILQTVIKPPLHAGDVLVFDLNIRIGTPDMLLMDIDLRYGESDADRVLARHVHPGDGQWHRMHVTLPVPRDAPEALRFAVHVRPELDGVVEFADARAYVLPAIP